jgi:hypothetical protein
MVPEILLATGSNLSSTLTLMLSDNKSFYPASVGYQCSRKPALLVNPLLIKNFIVENSIN